MMSAIEVQSTSSSEENSEDEEISHQPEGAGEGLQMCLSTEFVAGIASELEGIYGDIPKNFNQIRDILDISNQDCTLNRQMLRIAVNSLKREPSPSRDQLNRLVDAIAGIASFRASVEDGKKRKRGVN